MSGTSGTSLESRRSSKRTEDHEAKLVVQEQTDAPGGSSDAVSLTLAGAAQDWNRIFVDGESASLQSNTAPSRDSGR